MLFLGAKYIERHITLDKNMWGSDQKASLNRSELNDLILESETSKIVLEKEDQGLYWLVKKKRKNH